MTDREIGGKEQAARVRGQFAPGHSGNPKGKPKGARHKATRAVEALLEGEADALTRKAVELALGGDTTALRLCLERIAPPRKDSPVRFALPTIHRPEDIVAAGAAMLAAVASGDLTPSEAQAIGALLQAHAKTIELHDLEARVARLEQEKAR